MPLFVFLSFSFSVSPFFFFFKLSSLNEAHSFRIRYFYKVCRGEGPMLCSKLIRMVLIICIHYVYVFLALYFPLQCLAFTQISENMALNCDLSFSPSYLLS
jgi:hypothetical protein